MRDNALKLFALPAGLCGCFSESEPHQNQNGPDYDKWPGSSEKTIEPGGGVDPPGFGCGQQAAAPPGRHDTRDEQEQTTADAQIAALPLRMLLRKKHGAWLTRPSAPAVTLKRRPEQVDDYAQRPRLSDPDPWLADSVHVV